MGGAFGMDYSTESLATIFRAKFLLFVGEHMRKRNEPVASAGVPLPPEKNEDEFCAIEDGALILVRKAQ